MSNFHFNIKDYKALSSQEEKQVYINKCIFLSEKISTDNTINELKYIRSQIRKYCSYYVLLDGFYTGEKAIRRIDGSMLNYINSQINEYAELKEIILNNKDSSHIHFKCKLNDSQIEKLYIELIKNSFINDSCDKEVFKSIFDYENSPIQKEKIVWIGKANNKMFSAHSLFEFLNQCFFDVFDQKRRDLYSFIINHFLDGDGKEYDRENLKNSFSSFFRKKTSLKINRMKAESKIISIFSTL